MSDIGIERSPRLTWLAMSRALVVLGCLFVAAGALLPGSAAIDFGPSSDIVSCDPPIRYLLDRAAMGIPGQDPLPVISEGLACGQRARGLLAGGAVLGLGCFFGAVVARKRHFRPSNI